MAEYQVWLIFAILIAGIVLFVWHRIRYDLVAVLMLMALGLSGILAFEEMFMGFASNAVVTVAAALIISRALDNSGLLEKAAEKLLMFQKRPMLPIILLLTLVCIASGFINDIAALAMMLPIGLALSRALKLEPSKILIPLAYASLVGGALTLMGTASNIVASSIALRELNREIGIFEFTPVGLALIPAFLLIFWLLARRVLPTRKGPYEMGEQFELPKYIVEMQVTEKSDFIDKTIGELERKYEGRIEVVRIIRGTRERETPHSNTKIGLGDLLVVRAEAEDLDKITNESGLQALRGATDEDKAKGLKLMEVIVLPNSVLIDKTARQVYLRDWLNVTLLGIARHGSMLTRRVDDIRINMGDVLLIEAAEADLPHAFQELKCAPLHARGISLHAYAPPKLTVAIAAISISLTAFGILPVAVALAIGAVSMLVLRSLSLREAYDAVQWPILILIGCMIPFGIAMQKTGADVLLAQQFIDAGLSEPIVVLAVVYLATTLLSNVINNVAATVFMAPIALRLSELLDISGFPMIMAVAFGAAIPFLTPISHHSNLLVLEAGGYKFADYLRLGIPLTVVLALVVIFLVPIFWPF